MNLIKLIIVIILIIIFALLLYNLIIRSKIEGGLKSLIYEDNDIFNNVHIHTNCICNDYTGYTNYITQSVKNDLRLTIRNTRFDALNGHKLSDALDKILSGKDGIVIDNEMLRMNMYLTIHFKDFQEAFYKKYSKDKDKIWKHIAYSIVEFLLMYYQTYGYTRINIIKCLGKGSYNVVYLIRIGNESFAAKFGQATYHNPNDTNKYNNYEVLSILRTSQLMNFIKNADNKYFPELSFSIYDHLRADDFYTHYSMITSWAIMPEYINLKYHKQMMLPDNLQTFISTTFGITCPTYDDKLLYLYSLYKIHETLCDQHLWYYDWKYSNIMYSAAKNNFVLTDYDIPAANYCVSTYSLFSYIKKDYRSHVENNRYKKDEILYYTNHTTLIASITNKELIDNNNKFLMGLVLMLDLINYDSSKTRRKYSRRMRTCMKKYRDKKDENHDERLYEEYVNLFNLMKKSESISSRFIIYICKSIMDGALAQKEAVKTYYVTCFNQIKTKQEKEELVTINNDLTEINENIKKYVNLRYFNGIDELTLNKILNLKKQFKKMSDKEAIKKCNELIELINSKDENETKKKICDNYICVLKELIEYQNKNEIYLYDILVKFFGNV